MKNSLSGQLESTQLFRPSNFIGYSIASSSIVLGQAKGPLFYCYLSREKKRSFFRPFHYLLSLFIVFSANPAGPYKSFVSSETAG